MMSIKVKYDGEILKIYLPLEKPHASKSGKTMLIASTYGPQTTTVEHEGQKIVVVANAFFYPKDRKTSRRAAKHPEILGTKI
jgi:hypothetical protein